MKPGNIVLAIMPQDAGQKLRPVFILKILPGYGDFLVCAVSSQLHQFVYGFDLMIDQNHSAYKNSGLVTASIFRLASLAVLESKDIAGVIGYLPNNLHKQLITNLTSYLLS